jgi:hypothetical protein
VALGHQFRRATDRIVVRESRLLLGAPQPYTSAHGHASKQHCHPCHGPLPSTRRCCGHAGGGRFRCQAPSNTTYESGHHDRSLFRSSTISVGLIQRSRKCLGLSCSVPQNRDHRVNTPAALKRRAGFIGVVIIATSFMACFVLSDVLYQPEEPAVV